MGLLGVKMGKVASRQLQTTRRRVAVMSVSRSQLETRTRPATAPCLCRGVCVLGGGMVVR